MSCCGGKTVGKMADVVMAYGKLVTDAMHLTEPYEWADQRIAICRSDKCGHSTWMTSAEYRQWRQENGVVLTHPLDFLEKFAELEKLPLLPKYPLDEKRRNIYCMICKCFGPAKAQRKHLDCPFHLWPPVIGR
jgi:hypothetical protein